MLLESPLRRVPGVLLRRRFLVVAVLPAALGLAYLALQGSTYPSIAIVLATTSVSGFLLLWFWHEEAAGRRTRRRDIERSRLLLTARLQEQAEKLQATVSQRTRELREANASLRASAESNALLALVAQHTASGVVITDHEGRIEWVNAAFTRITGLALAAAKGRKLSHVLPGRQCNGGAVAELRAAERAGQACRVELLNRRPDDQPYWVALDLQPVRDPAGRLVNFVANVSDITAERADKTRLQQLTQRLQEVSRIAQIGGWEINLVTSQVSWDEGTRQIHEVDDTFLPTLDSMWTFLPPEALETVQAALRDATPARPAFEVEVPLVTARGRRIWVHLLGRGEFANGQSIRMRGAIQDITARHESEEARRELEAQLLQAQKMETLGTLAGGIAHDFNNLLTGIIGYHELAADVLAPEHAAREYLSEAHGASIRARELVEQILTFSRQSTLSDHVPLDLTTVVGEASRFLRATLPANIAIEIDTAPHCGLVLGDATQLHQVILNLGSNAAHAMRQHGGTLHISTGTADIGPDVALTLGGPAGSGYVRLSVSDTGHGMDEATRRRIFDPFFTTKKTREGTGLGLAVVHGIVRAHRGVINVESAPGEGSTFNIFLPTVAAENPTPEKNRASAPRGQGEYVCVVDDEAVVGSCSKLILEAQGYRAVVFPSAEDCVDGLKGSLALCSVLVTDQAMPGMQGTELAAALRLIRPDLPVVIMSGYFSKISPHVLDELGRVELLAKPFTSEELAHAVHRALTAAAPSPTSSRG